MCYYQFIQASASSPAKPAPAAPNKEAMMAMPVTDPSTAAPPAPSTAPAPAATRGAASPPVTPDENTYMITDTTHISWDQSWTCPSHISEKDQVVI